MTATVNIPASEQDRDWYICKKCGVGYDLADIHAYEHHRTGCGEHGGLTVEERGGNLGEVIDRRVQVYGDPVDTFPRVAQVWSGILGHEVNATDVSLLLIAYKLVRTQQTPDYADNSDDIEGYLDIFRQLVGEDMVRARSVSEYVEAKWGSA